MWVPSSTVSKGPGSTVNLYSDCARVPPVTVTGARGLPPSLSPGTTSEVHPVRFPGTLASPSISLLDPSPHIIRLAQPVLCLAACTWTSTPITTWAGNLFLSLLLVLGVPLCHRLLTCCLPDGCAFGLLPAFNYYSCLSPFCAAVTQYPRPSDL